MLIYACDVCKKKIKNSDQSIVLEQGYKRFSLCDKCSKPITAFLKKHGLIRPGTSSAWGKPKKQ